MQVITEKYNLRLSIAITAYCEGYRHARDLNVINFDNVPAEEIRTVAGEFLKTVKVASGRITPRALGMARFYLDMAKEKKAVA